MKKYINRKSVTFILVSIFCFTLGFFADYGWEKYRLQRIVTDDEAAMESLSKIIVLPEEIPSIATVMDKEKLAEQPFFQKAENGDKVIMYSENRRAYLYRPREQKIIDMTVIAVENTNQGIPTFQTDGQ